MRSKPVTQSNGVVVRKSSIRKHPNRSYPDSQCRRRSTIIRTDLKHDRRMLRLVTFKYLYSFSRSTGIKIKQNASVPCECSCLRCSFEVLTAHCLFSSCDEVKCLCIAIYSTMVNCDCACGVNFLSLSVIYFIHF